MRVEGHFIHLRARRGDVHETFLEFASSALNSVKEVQKKLGQNEYLQLRGIFWDDVHGAVSFFLDHIHQYKKAPSLDENEVLELLASKYDMDANGQLPLFNVKIIEEDVGHDNFFVNSPRFYEPSPTKR